MASTKGQQRAKLHRIIWSIAEDLRGSIDGWGFMQYVLNTLFYRFISENLSNYLAGLEGDQNFDYSKMSDEQAEYGHKATAVEDDFILDAQRGGRLCSGRFK